ncbi:MAG: alpha/beta hydrolase [Candidatus Dormibacteraeota bacterium]|nr:alpha/beta hydrolase [Candidatus Dormibacteraeota bacterium]
MRSGDAKPDLWTMNTGKLIHTKVGGHSVACRIAGEGPPLALLHGFLCDSRCWRPQLEGLADQFTVLAWDAPGAGLSSDPPDSFTVTDWAHTLAEFLDVAGFGHAHVLGLSWGGMLAQEFYRLYPARVDRLVLADTYAGWKGSLPNEMVEKRRARCYLDATRPAAEVVAEWVPTEFFTNASKALTAEMGAVVADFHPLGFQLMAKALADTDTSSVLSTIKAPTLLLWGEGDLRSPLSVAEQFHAAIPHSRLELIRDAGHVSNMERPDEFNQSVRRFLLVA